jgi:hypothetical protein
MEAAAIHWIRTEKRACGDRLSTARTSRYRGNLLRQQKFDPQDPLPVFTVDDPLAQASRVSTNNRNGMQRNLREGQVQQWNLTLQYLLTRNTLLEAAYIMARRART